MGCGRGAPGRGASHTEARQLALVYVAHHRKDEDARMSLRILGFMAVNTMSDIIVLSPLGQSVRINKMFKDVPLEIQGVIFLADLMELPFEEFDLILGMDWLVKHRVSVDCATKRVVLRTEADEEAEKLVCKGCEVFLAYVSVLDVGDSSVKDIITVRDFPDVFPKELPGLPPEREVEFAIELLPGTAPVSIAPCR
ncbi:uncharacterized protein LOC108475178 [Gossypium arboreum]|uniref:uncharacterized protein LOC108475178 n=1 Tax=Gossypium arboreum TaxID=29729 RepID=UPI00081974DB|nr:uncharacterized protein LOC108475178 [Gossypium arboreum]